MSTWIILCQALMKGREHRTIAYKFCFISGKIIRSPKNLELDVCSKNGQFHIFPWQAANSASNSEFRGGILLALIIFCRLACICECKG